MRSRERDRGGIISFSGVTPSGAASGVGVAQPGNIPYSYIRTATGDYTFRFDPALHALAMQAIGTSGPVVPAGAFGAGTFRLQSFAVAGGLSDGIIHFQCTARDRRL